LSLLGRRDDAKSPRVTVKYIHEYSSEPASGICGQVNFELSSVGRRVRLPVAKEGFTEWLKARTHRQWHRLRISLGGRLTIAR
jgi:hypothetical protein